MSSENEYSLTSSSNYSELDSELDSELNSESEEMNNIDLTGDILESYNIIYEIGHGAYSLVWLAYDITDQKFYAIKVQNYDDYEEGIDEVNILKKLPNDCKYLNKMKKTFVEERFVDDKVRKFICSVFELCCNNLDSIMRKGDLKYRKGFGKDSKKLFYQSCKAVDILHNKLKIFHGDIKPDNMLLVGTNNLDQTIIDEYKKYNFNEAYKKLKEKFWLEKGKNIKNI